MRENGLALLFLAIFLTALALQSLAGWQDFNNDQLRHQSPEIPFGRYLVSSEFGVAMLENWQSEYLQFTLYILATVWFVQRGSPESKEIGKQASSPTSARKWVATRIPTRRAGLGPAGCGPRCSRIRC